MKDTKITNFIKKMANYNESLARYENLAGDRNLPYIGCTIDGYSEVGYYRAEEDALGKKKIVTDGDGFVYEFTSSWESAFDEVREALSYDSRRLKKAWRVWKDENPDRALLLDLEY